MTLPPCLANTAGNAVPAAATAVTAACQASIALVANTDDGYHDACLAAKAVQALLWP